MTSHLGLLWLRLALGLTMLFAHGLPKLTGFSHLKSVFPDPIGMGHEISLALAIFAEALCSVALVLGVKTKFATLPLIVTMLVAIFVVHGADPFAKKELAFLYLSGYITLFLTGPGNFSVDRKILKSATSFGR